MWKRPWFPMMLAALVALPTLSSGVVLDDWLQRALVRGQLTYAQW